MYGVRLPEGKIMHGAVFPVLPFMLCFRQLMLALIYVSLKVNFERNEEKKTFYFAITQ